MYDKELLDSIKINEKYFIELIQERLGIVVHIHQTKELCDAVAEACINLNCNPHEYLEKIKTCTTDSPLLEFLVTSITIGETSFFRDKRQMKLLQNTLLPRLIRAKQESGDLSIRIWSAGCSTGEEIYTIAMMLISLIPAISAWNLNLLGTDINRTSLNKAKAGIYSRWSMRSIPDYYLNRYFSLEDKAYKLSSEVKNLVHFSHLNLTEHSYPSILNGTVAQDLILCRNVMIYFDNDHIAQIMNQFSQCLDASGFLILGASDPINISETPFIFHHEEAIYFSKN